MKFENMKNTSFKEYLIAKRNIIIALMCINSFALIVNVLKIKGETTTNTGITHFIFSDDDAWRYEEPFEDPNKKNFWPFVSFTKQEYNNYESVSVLKGIFRYYDYSEFFIYTILILLGLYISWELKRGIK